MITKIRKDDFMQTISIPTVNGKPINYNNGRHDQDITKWLVDYVLRHWDSLKWGSVILDYPEDCCNKTELNLAQIYMCELDDDKRKKELELIEHMKDSNDYGYIKIFIDGEMDIRVYECDCEYLIDEC